MGVYRVSWPVRKRFPNFNRWRKQQMSLTATEQKMWHEAPTEDKPKMSDGGLKEENWTGEPKILLEINREKLPSLVKLLQKPGSMDLPTFLKSRKAWEKQKQSRLIESFLINIPIPPIVLYKKHYNAYQVIDGQQRIAAIRDFYENKLELTGLEILSEIEGLTYRELPAKIKERLDRHSLSSIAIITKSNSTPEEALLLKQKAFERLNTEGVNLSNQEVRSCVYQGKFNSLLQELANNEIFIEAWKPATEDGVELILRFFALRNAEHFTGDMKDFLDVYMRKSLNFSEADIESLKQVFLETITLASELYGEYLFKPFDSQAGTWKQHSSQAYFDAVMVGLSRKLSQANLLIEQKLRVIEETKQLFKGDKASLLTRDEKNEYDFREGIDIFDEMLSEVIGK